MKGRKEKKGRRAGRQEGPRGQERRAGRQEGPGGQERQARMLERRIDEKMSKKLVGLFFMVMLALIALAVRITYINARDGEQYKRIVLSQTQQQYESRVIPFRRGSILDRNGTILAASEKVYNVILDCKVVNTTSKDSQGQEVKAYLEPTVKALVEVLGLDETDIRSRLEGEDTRNSQYQILKTNLSITEKKAFEDYLNQASEEDSGLSDAERQERNRVKGVWFEEDYLRVYPLNSLACDLIGFTYSDNSADWGIEGYYSDILNGTNGRQYGYFTSDADVEQEIIEPVDGKNVISTIDVNIQGIIRSAMETFETEMAAERAEAAGTDLDDQEKAAENIAILVMNPNTGEILGMDSSDWYDLNNPRDLTSFYSQEEIDAMDESTMLEALNDIWRNYCISDAFEPGSTVKPMTAAAALETASITTKDRFTCDGYEMVAGNRIRCSVFPDSHGEETVGDALVNSCNDVMMQVGAKLGGENFLHYQSIFNLGSKTGIDLPGENAGILHTEDSLGEAELATGSFGQGFTCTMVQEAAAFSSVINGGYYYRPRVVSAITNSDGSVAQVLDSVLERQTVSGTVSDYLRQELGRVVETGGTGTEAKVTGYSMGGKTGTAQKIPRDSGKYLVSYIGFAPLDHPQVVVYVVVDEPNVEDQGSSIYAQKIAKNIFTELLPYLNIFPDEEITEQTAEEQQNLLGEDQSSGEGQEQQNLSEEAQGSGEEQGQQNLPEEDQDNGTGEGQWTE